MTGKVDGGKGAGPEVARDVARRDARRRRRARGVAERAQWRCGDFVKKLRYLKGADIEANKKASWASRSTNEAISSDGRMGESITVF